MKTENRPNFKRRCTENNSSSFSNSGDQETNNYKNIPYPPEVSIHKGQSQADEEMRDDSMYSQTDNGNRINSELGNDGMRHNGTDSRSDFKNKRKQSKKSKNFQTKTKKLVKRLSEEQYSNDYQRPVETVEEFTKERSMKISKERLDIVESRTL